MIEPGKLVKYVMHVTKKGACVVFEREYHNIDVLEMNMRQAMADQNVVSVTAEEVRQLNLKGDNYNA